MASSGIVVKVSVKAAQFWRFFDRATDRTGSLGEGFGGRYWLRRAVMVRV
jgi:hypothetical protein